MTNHITLQWCLDAIYENRGKWLIGFGAFANMVIGFRKVPTQESPLWYVLFFCALQIGTLNFARLSAGITAAQTKPADAPKQPMTMVDK